MITKDELDRIHKSVPPDYYQKGIKKNIFQHYWHKRCFAFIADEIKKLNITGRILDLGCHSGDRTNLIYQTTQSEVYGLDISEKSIVYARNRFPKLKFVCNDFPEQVPFADNYFQALTAFDVMEHMPDTPRVLAEVKRLLVPGGYFVVGVPNENFLFKAVWFFWTKLKGQVWEGVHVHDFKTEGFGLFDQAGFTKISDNKIIFNMWWITIFRLDKK